jgi:hypothetical protein
MKENQGQKTAKRKAARPKPTHERFLRHASLHSVNRNAATLSPEVVAEAIRHFLEAEPA